MEQDEKKRAVARAALEFVKPGEVLGVGTGSTTNCFIDLLAPLADKIDGAISSSDASAKRLADLGVRLLDLNDVERIPLYVDGADEASAQRHLIKGGGGALTREKIVAAASERFVCIIDDGKRVEVLGVCIKCGQSAKLTVTASTEQQDQWPKACPHCQEVAAFPGEYCTNPRCRRLVPYADLKAMTYTRDIAVCPFCREPFEDGG